jgi:hypothetical protein
MRHFCPTLVFSACIEIAVFKMLVLRGANRLLKTTCIWEMEFNTQPKVTWPRPCLALTKSGTLVLSERSLVSRFCNKPVCLDCRHCDRMLPYSTTKQLSQTTACSGGHEPPTNSWPSVQSGNNSSNQVTPVSL